MTSRLPTPPPLDVQVAGDVSNVTAEWCPECKAYTLLTGETVLLTPGGVVPVGYWAWCETCDMAEEEPRRV